MVYPVDSEGSYAIRCKTCYSIVEDIPVSHVGFTPFLKKKKLLSEAFTIGWPIGLSAIAITPVRSAKEVLDATTLASVFFSLGRE
jgi:hypothetical protein